MTVWLRLMVCQCDVMCDHVVETVMVCQCDVMCDHVVETYGVSVWCDV